MPETSGQHKDGPKGKEQSEGPPSRRLLCILFCDRENNTCLAAPHNAGLIADFVLGWYRHAKRRRKGERGNYFSLAKILAGTGLSVNQWRDAKPWLEGAVHVEHGGEAGKRALFMRPTAQLQRFVAGRYSNKKAALRALEALQQAPVEPEDTTPVPLAGEVAPTGTTAGQNHEPNQAPNLILSSLSAPSPHGVTNKEEIHAFDSEKEKPGKTGPSAQGFKIEPEAKYTPPAPPAGGTVDLDALVEVIYAAKVGEIEESQPPTEDDILFEQGAKKHFLIKLKKDLMLFPEIPIPDGCPLVHPMCKDPVGWAGLSKKAKTDLYANKFLPYLENWKKGKAGKHAANV